MRNGLNMVLGHMSLHPTSTEVQSLGANALLGLVYKSPKVCETLVDHEGLDLTLHAMETHKQSAECQENCCRLLSVVCLSEQKCREQLAKPEHLRVLFDSLKNHPESAGLIANLFNVLSGLVEGETAHQSAVFAVPGGIELLLKSLKQHPFEEVLQQNGCCVVGSLAENNEGIRARMEELGAAQLIKVALAEFPDSDRLQAHGKWAMEILKTPLGGSWLPSLFGTG